MKRIILLPLIFISLSQISLSQTDIAFAITGQGNGDFNWKDIRGIDMTSGNVTQVLFENGKTKFSFLNAETGNQMNPDAFSLPASFSAKQDKTISNITVTPSPTNLMSAAIAYDKKHGKIFFASLYTGQLIWLDLRSRNNQLTFYTIGQPLVHNSDLKNEAFNITRMTIGANGNGYALTNDANHLLTFTTGSKTIVTDLGNLVDAESNNAISIHNKCSSWGGDMVGDVSGKLILFTAAHQVFEIDVNTRIATFKGAVLNLPAAFSLNGAAVNVNGEVIVSSANPFGGFYKIHMADLSASKLNTTGQVFNASDLASSYLLNQNNTLMGAATLPQIDVIGNRFVTIYPNPVNDGEIKISFDNNPSGEYKIQLSDLQGRIIDYKKVYIKSPGQLEKFKLSTKPVKGLYLIDVTDIGNKKIFSDKLLIE